MRVVVALFLTRVHRVGQRRVEKALHPVSGAKETATTHEHDGVAAHLLSRSPAAARVPAGHVFNGVVVRELFVDLDDDAHPLVWSVADGPYTHHNASAQVFPEEDGGTRFVWIADLLPDGLAGHIDALMEQGTRVLKRTMEA